MESFGHDHVEEAMGYEHTVEGMSLTDILPFCADTIMTTKESKVMLLAHVGHENQGGHLQWQAPQVDHDIQLQPEEPPVQIPAEDHVADDLVEVPRRYPDRVRNRPDYF